MKNGRRLWWFVVAWAAIIFVLSAIPGKAMPNLPGLSYDKLLHGLVYSVLGGAFCLALRHGSSLTTARIVAAAALFAVAYGVTDEVHQLFVSGRNADVFDVIADGVGGLLGATIATRLPLAQSG
jgi:VanZ family protein